MNLVGPLLIAAVLAFGVLAFASWGRYGLISGLGGLRAWLTSGLRTRECTVPSEDWYVAAARCGDGFADVVCVVVPTKKLVHIYVDFNNDGVADSYWYLRGPEKSGLCYFDSDGDGKLDTCSELASSGEAIDVLRLGREEEMEFRMPAVGTTEVGSACSVPSK